MDSSKLVVVGTSNKEISRVFTTELGFTRSAVDHSIFYRRSGEEHTVVAVATDDMALTSKRRIDIEKLKEEISRHWDISDKGELSWYLGFEVKRNRAAHTISINQCSYIEQMTEKFRLTNAKPVSTPMEPGAQFTKEQGPSTPTQMMRMRNVPYAEAIGSVLWPVMISRPDAAFSVSVLSQFIQNPGRIHWEALQRVIVYLNSTKDLWLTFGGRTTSLEGYCDADWAGQKDTPGIPKYNDSL